MDGARDALERNAVLDFLPAQLHRTINDVREKENKAFREQYLYNSQAVGCVRANFSHFYTHF